MGAEAKSATIVRKDAGLMSAGREGQLLMMRVDDGRYFNLNGVGARIWELLGRPTTTTDLVDTLVAEYAVEREAARHEVENFLSELRAYNLLTDAATA